MPTVTTLTTGYGPAFSLERFWKQTVTEADSRRLSQPIPALGRYRRDVALLERVTSQRVVATLRFRVVIERFLALNDLLTSYDGQHRHQKVVHSLSGTTIDRLRSMELTDREILMAEYLEHFTEHDTAAAIDTLKIWLGTRFPELEPFTEGLGFADTSEDTMSIVFGLIGNRLVYGHVLPQFLDLIEQLLALHDSPLPGFTHQQAAEPTTFRKNLVTCLHAVLEQLGGLVRYDKLRQCDAWLPFSGKLGGAIGNWSTHLASYSDIDWVSYSRRFVTALGLGFDDLVFQSNSYWREVSIFSALANAITHLIKLFDDLRRLAAAPGQLFVKRKRAGTKGSSVMLKVNLWQTEGACEMLIKVQEDCNRYAKRLPSFTHQGDMARSYLMRNLGTVFADFFIAINRLTGELVGDQQITGGYVHAGQVADCFDRYPGLCGSLMQTVLKRAGFAGDAYRALEAITIKPDGTTANRAEFLAGLTAFIERAGLDEALANELTDLTEVSQQTGAAEPLAEAGEQSIHERLTYYRQLLSATTTPLVDRWFASC